VKTLKSSYVIFTLPTVAKLATIQIWMEKKIWYDIIDSEKPIEVTFKTKVFGNH